MQQTALIYCEGFFGKMDGKTANGLIRNSQKYRIVGVIDSTKAGMDAGEYIEGIKNDIPVFINLDHALECLSKVPNAFIYGIAPAEAFLKENERNIVLHAMKKKLDIVNTLHEFFSEDAEFVECSQLNGVAIYDIRQPPKASDRRLFSGRILNIHTPVLAVLGTDSAVGKRTTSMLLVEALIKEGLHAVFVATGQTGLIQGAKYGVAIDALPSQYVIGEIENQIMMAHDQEHPDIIIVEGQGAVSHPAYISSCGILRGSRPGSVIVQHAPKRKCLGDFPFMEVPTVKSEIEIIESFSQAKVIAVTINHENMSNKELSDSITTYEEQLHLPTTDVLTHGCDKLITSILEKYPELKNQQNKGLV